jgi:Ca2+-binding EF-hand superfamily protein
MMIYLALLLTAQSLTGTNSGTESPSGEIKLDFNLDEAMVGKFDRNKDKALNLNEFQNVMEAQLRKAIAANPTAKAKMKNSDLIQFRKGLEAPFRSFDRNSNGSITLLEMRGVIQERRK